MSKPVVVVSTSGFAQVAPTPLERLRAAGIEVKLNSTGRQLTADEARDTLAGAVGVIAGTEPLTRDVLRALPGLRVISRVGTGLDSVDLEAARELGIAVRNTPDAHVDAVAELTLAGILAALRHVCTADRAVRTKWKKPMGRLLKGATVGFVGMGRVGKALAELMAPFHVRVLAYDTVRDPKFEYVALDELLRASDVVSLHVPYTKATHDIIGAAQLAMMKPDALLANCSRGKLIDEDALLAHLRTHPEASCYLDCFEQEPYTGPLRELDNIVLTSHIGGYARESRLRMELEAVDNLLAVLAKP